MKIDLIKLNFDNEESYKIQSVDYCCEKIKHNPLIELTHEYVGGFNACKDCPDDSPYKICKWEETDQTCPRIKALEEPTDENGYCLGMALCKIDTYPEPYEDYYTTDYYHYPIHFCPHCGEKIEITVSEELDVTDVYKSLKERRKELWDKFCKTDSKKKESELQKQVQDLDNRIEDFYTMSEYKKEKYKMEE